MASIREVGKNRWKLIVHVGAGKQRTRSFEGTRRQAERAAAEFQADLDSGRRGTAGRETVNDLATEWIETHFDELSPSTRRQYRRLLEVRVLPALGRMRVAEVRTSDIEHFYRRCTASGLAPASVHRIHAVVRGLFTTAVRWGWISVNPAQAAKRPKAIVKRRRIVGPDEVATLIAAAVPDLQFVLHLAAATGMRRGELVALRWSAVDLEHAQLHVRAALVMDEHDQSILIEKPPKSNQVRRISLDANTVRMFHQQRAMHAERAQLAGAAIPIDGFVISDDCGFTPWRPDRITLMVVRLANKLGLDGFRFHDLRHFHASEIANAGIPLEAVRERLGHSSVTVTGLYLHSPETADRAAAETIGRILGG